MANNVTNVMPKILAQGVLATRQNAVYPRLVYRDYQQIAQQKGNVINVPIPSAIAKRSVTPAVAFAANVDSAPTVAQVTLDQWDEAPIYMSDNDTASADPMIVQMQASEAIKSLINGFDQYILSKHTGFYAFAGAAGTTPFNGSLTVAGTARLRLNFNLAPMDGRVAVLNPDAENNLLQNTQILNFDQSGDQGPIIRGTIGTKLGFAWYMNQNNDSSSGSYTPGTGWVTGFTVSTTTGAAGDSTLQVLNATASGTIKVGDLFQLGTNANHQYVVTAAATASATVGVTLSIKPPLRAAASLGTTLAVVATAYTVNLAFTPLAIAFANRPLQNVFNAGNNIFQAPVDAISGVAVRLELSRQYKQETLSWDSLYGANGIRSEYGCKILG